jgi:hypothetical protein
MTAHKLILRAHTELQNEKKAPRRKGRNKAIPKWPASLLVFDCETRVDTKQSLTFGPYRVCGTDQNDRYTNIREEGFFYDPNEVTPKELGELESYVAKHNAETANDVSNKLCLRTRQQFLEQVFLPMALGGSLIVGFNLPFDLSRLAADSREARRLNDDWSFVLIDQPFSPRIILTRKDGKIAFSRLSGVRFNPKTKKRVRIPRGRFLDVRTLAWSLRNVTFSLKSLCDELKTPPKMDYDPTGVVHEKEIKYARQDIRATIGALNALRGEFDRFPVDLAPDKAYSPASIVKAYLSKMGVTPPLKKFPISSEYQGIGAQTFYGGRTECRIRRTALPVVHTDFKSEYPTAITLMGLWRIVIARRLKIENASAEVRNLLATIDLNEMFKPSSWTHLNCLALVRPDGDILPVRTEYDADNGENNVGVNHLTSDKPIWVALPDLIASKLLTGKAPKILRAIRFVGVGQQSGLESTTLAGRTIDPRTGDFFKTIIELRELIKRDKSISESERESFGYFLKILANAGYGIFIETTPKQVPGREGIDVSSGEFSFPTTSAIVEDKGPWYCPVVASLITSAGRMFLAMLECAVRDAGGTYLFADTDSMAIVATKDGGLLSCAGGDKNLPDGRSAVLALSWAAVEGIASRFNQLNPYDRVAVPSILKIEDVNYEDGVQRQLEGYAISSKRYTFFVRTPERIEVITPSEHGLGHLFMPKSKFDKKQGAHIWIIKTWKHLLHEALGRPHQQPTFFSLPAMMRFGITTPEVLKTLQKRELENGASYRDRIKPFNFILSPMINRQVYAVGSTPDQTRRFGVPTTANPDQFTLIAAFNDDPSTWFTIPWVNIHNGRWFYLAPLEKKQNFEASPYTIADIVNLYHIHPESKSLAPDGSPCGWHTEGLLKRTWIVADGFEYIGKESDRKWEQDDDINMLFPLLPLYRPDETEKLIGSSPSQASCRSVSKRKLAALTGMSTRTVQAARKGRRIRKSTARKIAAALRNYHVSETRKLEAKRRKL